MAYIDIATMPGQTSGKIQVIKDIRQMVAEKYGTMPGLRQTLDMVNDMVERQREWTPLCEAVKALSGKSKSLSQIQEKVTEIYLAGREGEPQTW